MLPQHYPMLWVLLISLAMPITVSHLCSMISHPCETEKTGYGCCGWSAAPRRRWGPLGKVVGPGPNNRPDLSARQVAVLPA